MITLYKNSATGAMRKWSMEVVDEGLEVNYGKIGGSFISKVIYVEENKSGRTWEEQVDLEYDSRVNKQLDKGYVRTIEEAKVEATNSLGLKKPMLAATYSSVTIVPREVCVQYKYDGNRCIITKQNGKVFGYSRNGKKFKSIDHILEAAKDIPEGTYLDGELYAHGVPLQTLRSWIAKDQAESNNLTYVVYDMIGSEAFLKRFKALENLSLSYPITLAETSLENSVKVELELYKRLDKAIKDGYEGLMLRSPNSGYGCGKRSAGLLKVKAWKDTECTVKGIESSNDGWAILVCRFNNGRMFKVSAPGTIEDKYECFKNRDKYLGKQVTVKFANLTKDGVPFHPVAVAWRSKND
jgi:DNA ligase 1